MPSRKTLTIATAVVVMGFVAVLVVLSVYGGVDNYMPTTRDGAVIFREACARCHGEAGVGGDSDGPRLAGHNVTLADVREHVVEGKGRMPRFPNIRGPALENLARYVNAL
jgi:mono/diheme cytochrome c family protein